MKLRFLSSVLAASLLLAGAAEAHAQLNNDRDGHAATPAEISANTVIYRHIEMLGKVNYTHSYEVVFGTVPQSTAITITPCMAGGTCGTPFTSSTNGSQVLTSTGIWDYYNVSITWTGTVTSVQLNITGAPVAARNGSGPGPGSGGTVTSVAVGGLSGLFTSQTANASTTPSTTFTLSSQTAAYIFAAPAGGNGTPTFRPLVGTDYPLATTSARGAMPALSNNAGQYLNGLGQWTTPSGGGTAAPQTAMYSAFPTSNLQDGQQIYQNDWANYTGAGTGPCLAGTGTARGDGAVRLCKYNATTAKWQTADAVKAEVNTPNGIAGTDANNRVGTAQIPPVVFNSSNLIVVAASNSINKAAANFVATGTNDDAIINAALTSCPSTLPSATGTNQCTVVLQPGLYSIGSGVIVDQDNVTLTGEGNCMWGGYLGAYTSTSNPAGVVGNGCAQLRAATSGIDLIQIQHNHTAGNGYTQDQQRHRGIEFKNLYLVGNGYTGTGIRSVCGTNANCTHATVNGIASEGEHDDNSLITDVNIQKTQNGINVLWDTPNIKGNSIQDIAGSAIISTGDFGRITSNLIFDIGGDGVDSSTDGQVIANNIIGATNGFGVYGTKQMTVTGNQFFQTRAGATQCFGCAGAAITGNQITVTTYGNAVAGDQVAVDSTSTGVAVTGNAFNAVTATGNYAINDQGANGSVSGNSAIGSWNGGGNPFSVALSNQTVQDVGSTTSMALMGSAGIHYTTKDTQNGSKPTTCVSSGTDGICVESYNGAYGKPTLQLGSTGAGGAIDFVGYRSIQSDNSGGLGVYSGNSASSGSLPRLYIPGGANKVTVQFQNANHSTSQTITPPEVVTFSATPTFDATTEVSNIILTGNVTSSSMAYPVEGAHKTFIVCQDSTGNRTFTPPPHVLNMTAVGGTANSCSVQAFIGHNTYWYSLGPGVTNQ